MNNKISKTKKAFSLIELIIVIAIVVIMTAVLFVNRNSGRASSDVKNVSRQVAAQIRALQNEALNGKSVGSQNVCWYGFKTTNGSKAYSIEYSDCTVAVPPANPNISGTQTVDLSKKRVSFSGTNADMVLSFESPRGNVYGGVKKTIGITSEDGSVTNFVCVSAAGIVTEQTTIPCQ